MFTLLTRTSPIVDHQLNPKKRGGEQSTCRDIASVEVYRKMSLLSKILTFDLSCEKRFREHGGQRYEAKNILL